VSDRLAELRRQRDLLQQHLAWLDTEIAAESRAPTARPTVTPTPAAPTADPDAILRQLRADSGAAQARMKLGCWAAFAGALLLFGFGIALWFVIRTR